jgi:transposase-like protein
MKSEWLKHIKLQAESGKSCREYCREAGLKASTFLGWRKKLGEGFVEVPLPESGVSCRYEIEINLPFKISIRVRRF